MAKLDNEILIIHKREGRGAWSFANVAACRFVQDFQRNIMFLLVNILRHSTEQDNGRATRIKMLIFFKAIHIRSEISHIIIVGRFQIVLLNIPCMTSKLDSQQASQSATQQSQRYRQVFTKIVRVSEAVYSHQSQFPNYSQKKT